MAYRADIEIGVRGTRQLEQLRSEITKTSVAAQSLSDVVSARGSLVQNIQNYQSQLNRVSNALSLVTVGTKAETKAIGEYVTILGQKNTLQQRQLNLIDTEIKKRQELARVAKLTAAGVFETTRFKQPIGPQQSPLQGQSSPVNERIARTIAQRKDEQRLQKALLQLELKSAALDNKKLIARGQINATLAKEVQLLTSGIRITSAQYASPIGPALPPKGSRGAAGGGIGKGISGAVSNAAIGGAFPLLFGQSGAAAAGGALGGIAGSFLGPSGGFAGSLVGTILGEKLGQGNQVKQLGEDIGFSAEQTKMLGVAFQQAGRDFDKFQQSVSTIQGLSLSIEDQAKAIQLASSLTETYKGKIDKVTNAFAGALSTGKVTQGTLNQLTNNGIPIQQALADKYNVSRSAIIQMAKDGKISVQDLIDTLVKVGNEGAKAAGTQKDVFADSFEKISKAVADFQTTASKAFKETGDALRVDLGGAVQAVTTYITDLIGGFGELARVAGPVLDPIISGYINLEKAIFNAVGAVPALKDAIISFVLTTLGPLQGVVTLMNQIRGLGAAAKGPEKMGPYVPDRLKQKPLQSFIAPSQAVPSDKGSSEADKAAKAAEREAARVANIVRDRAAATEQLRLQMQYSHGIFVAETAKDPFLKMELELQQKIGEISLDYSKQINDEKAKGNSAAVKEAITQHALAKTEAERLKYAMDVKKLEFERKENYDNLLMDLNQEIALRSATTEEARNQLRIAYEMAKLEQTKMYNTDQLAAIQSRKQQLAAPKTPYETIDLARGAASDELTKLLDVGNQIVTIGDAIGTSFGESFKGIISGTMTAQEALASFFQSVADAFLDMAAQIIAKWITMTILNSVLQLFPGGGLAKAGGAGFNMGAINNTGLSTFNSTNSFANLGMKAAGGPVAGGTPYIVGEKGPELFVPGRGGTIVPNHAMGGGTTNVVVNVDASGNSSVQGDQQQAKQLGVAVSAAVQAELIKHQRPGGLLAGTRR